MFVFSMYFCKLLQCWCSEFLFLWNDEEFVQFFIWRCLNDNYLPTHFWQFFSHKINQGQAFWLRRWIAQKALYWCVKFFAIFSWVCEFLFCVCYQRRVIADSILRFLFAKTRYGRKNPTALVDRASFALSELKLASLLEFLKNWFLTIFGKRSCSISVQKFRILGKRWGVWRIFIWICLNDNCLQTHFDKFCLIN